jgi:hypothetical protein
MDTKEKLLKLINACVENFEFYHGDSRPIISSYDYKQKYIVTVFNIKKEDESCRHYDAEPYNELVTKLELYKNSVYEEAPNNITIYFTDSPEIKILNFCHEVSSEVVSTHSVNRFKTNNNKTKKGFFSSFSFKSAEEEKPEQLKLNVYKNTYENSSWIISGELKAQITREEHEAIWNRVIENKEKFIQTKDLKKLDERFQKYVE